MIRTFNSHSVEDTIRIAKEFARELSGGDVVTLEADLGAGKTHFVKGIAEYVGVPSSVVTSPTFTFIHRYDGGTTPIIHIDCYRLSSSKEIENIGLIDCLTQDAIILIEWPRLAEPFLPASRWGVTIVYGDQENDRVVTIERK